jgi:hypothetical protein
MTVFQRDEVGIVEVCTSDYDGLRSIHFGCDDVRVVQLHVEYKNDSTSTRA